VLQHVLLTKRHGLSAPNDSHKYGLGFSVVQESPNHLCKATPSHMRHMPVTMLPQPHSLPLSNPQICGLGIPRISLPPNATFKSSDSFWRVNPAFSTVHGMTGLDVFHRLPATSEVRYLFCLTAEKSVALATALTPQLHPCGGWWVQQTQPSFPLTNNTVHQVHFQ
jgi:hypothetical protein